MVYANVSAYGRFRCGNLFCWRKSYEPDPQCSDENVPKKEKPQKMNEYEYIKRVDFIYDRH